LRFTFPKLRGSRLAARKLKDGARMSGRFFRSVARYGRSTFQKYWEEALSSDERKQRYSDTAKIERERERERERRGGSRGTLGLISRVRSISRFSFYEQDLFSMTERDASPYPETETEIPT